MGRNASFNVAEVDRLLTTTRSVRKKLDLERYLVHGPAISGTAMAALENPADAEAIVTGRSCTVRANLVEVVEGMKKEAET